MIPLEFLGYKTVTKEGKKTIFGFPLSQDFSGLLLQYARLDRVPNLSIRPSEGLEVVVM